MTEPSPPPYYSNTTTAPIALDERDLRLLRATAHAAYDGQIVNITGRQLRALLVDYDAPKSPDLKALTQQTPAEFIEYMKTNYPPGVVISDPAWHAPKIFRAACYAIEQAMKRG